MVGFILMLLGFVSLKESAMKGYVWIAFGAIGFSSGLVKIFKAREMLNYQLCPACQAPMLKSAIVCPKCGAKGAPHLLAGV